MFTCVHNLTPRPSIVLFNVDNMIQLYLTLVVLAWRLIIHHPEYIGDKCLNKEIYGLSKILCTSINNNSKLALCHIKLQEYTKSVIETTKVNNVFTWKTMWFDYLSTSKFCLVASCGFEVIKYIDHVEEVVIFYSDLVHFTHLVSLLEQGLGSEDERHRKKIRSIFNKK